MIILGGTHRSAHRKYAYLCRMMSPSEGGIQPVVFRDLGRMDYQAAWDYQEYLLQQNVKVKSLLHHLAPEEAGALKELPETTHYFLFCEHPPVYTLGKSGKLNHLLINNRQLQERGIEFFHTNRGGDITYHGPGQIVGYPILDLERIFTDLGRYLRGLEEVIIRTIGEYGIKGDRSLGETGVWIDPDVKYRARKICAMGVRCSRWITMHGFALNVNTDLSYFSHIIPCGISDKQVTSIEKELGGKIPEDEVKEKLRNNFEKVFSVSLQEITEVS